MAMFVFGRQTI